MKTYRVKYVYEEWCDVEITANSEEEANDKFWDMNFDSEPVIVGGEIQNNIDIEELEGANA